MNGGNRECCRLLVLVVQLVELLVQPGCVIHSMQPIRKVILWCERKIPVKRAHLRQLYNQEDKCFQSEIWKIAKLLDGFLLQLGCEYASTFMGQGGGGGGRVLRR